MQQLLVAWETGQSIESEGFSSMDEETIEDLYDMITVWKRTEREHNYFNLAMIIGGDPDDNKSGKK
jgi:hypothetical protein